MSIPLAVHMFVLALKITALWAIGFVLLVYLGLFMAWCFGQMFGPKRMYDARCYSNVHPFRKR